MPCAGNVCLISARIAVSAARSAAVTGSNTPRAPCSRRRVQCGRTAGSHRPRRSQARRQRLANSTADMIVSPPSPHSRVHESGRGKSASMRMRTGCRAGRDMALVQDCTSTQTGPHRKMRGRNQGWTPDTPARPGARVHPPATAIALIAAMCVIHTCSQFLRTSIGVIAPGSGARNWPEPRPNWALCRAPSSSASPRAQVPLGVAIDRFGPRLVLLVSTGIAVVGTIVFATAKSPSHAASAACSPASAARASSSRRSRSIRAGSRRSGSPPLSEFSSGFRRSACWRRPRRSPTPPPRSAGARASWSAAGVTAVVGLHRLWVARDYPPGVVPPRRQRA